MHICSVRRIPEDELEGKIQEHQYKVSQEKDITNDSDPFVPLIVVDIFHQIDDKYS